ncbi:hypothetical protein PIB30_096245, partial [Stylosanthes scabra]|nr:hypothetical protein [Stylosanthes scabra]
MHCPELTVWALSPVATLITSSSPSPAFRVTGLSLGVHRRTQKTTPICDFIL